MNGKNNIAIGFLTMGLFMAMTASVIWLGVALLKMKSIN